VAGALALVLGRPHPAGPPATPAPAPDRPVELDAVRIVAVGDVMMHHDVQASARQAEGGLQDLWTEVTPLLRGADLAFANLETPVAPRTGEPGRPFQFNGPEGLPRALRASGFTVLALANNHAYDQGREGLAETLERVRAAGLEAVGAGPTRDQAEAPRILEVHGIRVAFLGFTALFNVNLNRRSDEPWVCPLDPDRAVAAVRRARALADAVVVSLHWGVEYRHDPAPAQRDLAGRLAEAGADLILGHHPHVLQPVEMLERGGRRTLVAYSLGNFVSNQDRVYQAGPEGGDSRDGVALQCRLVRERLPDGQVRVRVAEPRCEPLWTENNWRDFTAGRARRREIRVVPVNAALASLRADLARPGGGDPDPADRRQVRLRTLEARRDRAGAVLGRAFLEP
jgi:poly-gamma-glutamate synthesis protein (capsule biosynthesis protein)